ncbi:uncharacterized protein LOC119079113 isoform X2 [Bradysia coprophila]|uniref:uncharacterized protein LOC119079113 isoform X2 n=1 Tax=Bradysia coprophila TaxID=38358 RepID=UPI00187DABEB|nr:uncharacterized protein LOC119079113 isoform X2 [Bradysia coprophila]
MVHLGVFAIFPIIFGVTLGAQLSDAVREVHLKKLSNESMEYEFEYDLDNGDTFRGQTYAVIGTIYFMFGPEGEIYWTNIYSNDYKEDEKFTKIVRKAERDGDEIEFKDDSIGYYMTVGGYIKYLPYATKWDLKNICFTKAADNQTFNFTISSLNNSKKYNGTTYLEGDDPKIQRLGVIGGASCNGGVYEIHFTDVELLSDEVFCRGYDKPIELQTAPLGTAVGMWLNPSLLKTLVG